MPLPPPVRRLNPTFPGLGPAVLIILAILGMQVACTIPLAIWAVARHGPEGVSALVSDPWALGVINVIAIGSVVLFCLRHTGERPRQFFKVRPIRLPLIIPIVIASAGLAIVLDQVDNAIVHLLGKVSKLVEVPLDLNSLVASPLGAVLVLVFIAPLTEEYAVRGLILRGLLRRHAPAIAILISAVMFGVMHVNLRQFIVGLATGGLFGWWYYRTASVAPGLLGHAVFNGVATLALLWPEAVPYLGHLSPDGEVVFQPWWFNLLGVLATVVGLLWFHAASPPAPSYAPPPVPDPPILNEAAPPVLAPPPGSEPPPAIDPTSTP